MALEKKHARPSPPAPKVETASPAVTDDAVTLHLSKAQTTIARTTLNRLPGEDLSGTSAAANTHSNDVQVDGAFDTPWFVTQGRHNYPHTNSHTHLLLLWILKSTMCFNRW